MPVLKIYLDTGEYTPKQLSGLLECASAKFAETLLSPKTRVRVYLQDTPSSMAMVGDSYTGEKQSAFFKFYILKGRPPDQKTLLFKIFTDLISTELGIPIEEIRGVCREVHPEDWSIGGLPASGVRKHEIRARKNKQVGKASDT